MVKYGKLFNCFLRVFAYQLLTFGQTIQPDKGILIRIMSGGFAQLSGIADNIQHIVPDLEGQPQASGKASGGLDQLFPNTSFTL